MTAADHRSIEVRFYGGPYDGDTMRLAAVVDDCGDLYPTPAVWRMPQPPEPLLVVTPPWPPVPYPPHLVYDRQHRGGQWVYVLSGMDEAGLPPKTDPVLERFVAHVREHWAGRQEFHACTSPIDEERRLSLGSPYEEHLRRDLMHQLHQAAADADMMILAVDGPRWQRQSTGDPFDDEAFEVHAVGLPRYHLRKRTADG